tara:strand:- start:191 stop:661 length:471 start_codon:yes stop_codon:yes gene_type:complete
MANSNAIWNSYLQNHDNYSRSVMGQHLQKQDEEKALAAQNNVLDFSPGNANDSTQEILSEVGENSLIEDVARTGLSFAPFTKTGQNVLSKTITKTLPKAASKLALRGVPYAGWGMLAADMVDGFMPQNYGPYNLFGLLPENDISGFLSLKGNSEDG